MASYPKEDNVFTRNPLGGKPGKTDCEVSTKGANVGGGGSILAAFPQDNVHGVDLPNTMGKALKGSDSNLSHSLTGASAVQRQTGKVENSGI